MNRQHHKLALYLFGSILIHVSMAIAISRRRSPITIDVAEITPIAIIEIQTSSDTVTQPKSAPKPEAKTQAPTAAKKAPEPIPEPPAPIPKQPVPKPEPTPEPEPTPLTSTESNIVTPSDGESEIDRLIRANQAKRQSLDSQQPVIDRLEQTASEQSRLPQADSPVDSVPTEDSETEAESNPVSDSNIE